MGKRILVTGENSYIGKSLQEYVDKEKIGWQIDAVSVRDEKWREIDYTKYQAVVHLAAVVHQKEQKEMRSLYKQINADLPVNIAAKAKESGVAQFVFLSTMAVYGDKVSYIKKNTKLQPVTMYGKAKLSAEKRLKKIADSGFQVIVLRPPLVYGRNCPGNYKRLASLALKLPFFPRVDNKRSMIYIENLCACICHEIEHAEKSYRVVCPQNREYVNTTELVREIRKAHGKRTWVIPFGGKLIDLLAGRIPVFGKVFGDLVYEKSKEDKEYQAAGFGESVRRTEQMENVYGK